MTTNKTYTTESNSAYSYNKEEIIKVSYLNDPVKCYTYDDKDLDGGSNPITKVIITKGSNRYSLFLSYSTSTTTLSMTCYTNMPVNITQEQVSRAMDDEDAYDKLRDEAEYFYQVTYVNILKDAMSECVEDGDDHRYFGISRLANVYVDSSLPMLVVGAYTDVEYDRHSDYVRSSTSMELLLETIKGEVMYLVDTLSKVDKNELLKGGGVI